MSRIQIFEANGIDDLEGTCFAQCPSNKEKMVEMTQAMWKCFNGMNNKQKIRMFYELKKYVNISKWILIEVENQGISEPDIYDTYEEAYKETKRRYEAVMEDNDKTNITDFYADIQSDSYNVDLRIFKVKM